MGNDVDQASEAARVSTGLQQGYASVGVPALKGNMAYLRGALGQAGDGGQLPGYVQQAYESAKGGAYQSQVGQLTGARGQLAAKLGATGGGAYLQGLGKVEGAGSTALANETSHIATTQALAGLEQRNKLLNLMSGQGASATNLSAGFGSLTNQGLGQSLGSNDPYGPIMGGISALTSIYANSQMNQQPTLGAAPPSANNWQGFTGNMGT